MDETLSFVFHRSWKNFFLSICLRRPISCNKHVQVLSFMENKEGKAVQGSSYLAERAVIHSFLVALWNSISYHLPGQSKLIVSCANVSWIFSFLFLIFAVHMWINVLSSRGSWNMVCVHVLPSSLVRTCHGTHLRMPEQLLPTSMIIPIIMSSQ